MSTPNAGFVTERVISKPPIVISVQQQDEETVELIASRMQPSGSYASYCLGIFEDGKLNLCVVGVNILHELGIQSDQLGRMVVGVQ